MALYQPQPMMQAGGGLLNVAANHTMPMTSGLLSSLSNQVGQMPAGTTNYSQIAYNSAGSPHVGPYAQVAPPSGVGVPGTGAASSGSSIGSTAGGLLMSMAQNPSLVKNAVGAIKGLLGPSNSGVPTSTPNPQMTTMPFDATAALAGVPLAAGSLGLGAAPAGTATLGALQPLWGTAGAAGAGAAGAAGAGGAVGSLGMTSMPFDAAAAAPASVSAGAGAGAAGAAGAGASSAAVAGIPWAGLGAVALPLAASIYGPFSQPVTMGAKEWNGLGASLTPVPQGGSALNSPADAQLSALLGTRSGDVPRWLQALAKQDGISALPIVSGNGVSAKPGANNNFVQKV